MSVKMKKELERQLKALSPGDLVCVEWFDASKGRIETARDLGEVGVSNGVRIDSPVKSYGIYIGIFGSRAKHVIIVASLWVHTTDYGQVDSTVIPLGVIESARTIAPKVMEIQNVRLCQQAFLQGRCYHFLQRFQIRNRKFAE